MTQHEVITQIRDAITTGDYGLAVRALNEYRDAEIQKAFLAARETDLSYRPMYDNFSQYQKSLNKQ